MTNGGQAMIDHRQLRRYVIRPVLETLGVYSQPAEELLVLTAAHESRLGQFLHQVGGGPAIGIFQMEPATHDDIWRNWLHHRPQLAGKVGDFCVPGFEDATAGGEQQPDSGQMAGNLYYATAMCRCHYLRVPDPLPAADDVEGLADYWKTHYNTALGAGTVAQAVAHYRQVVA